jgi:hypothetical protein
MTPTLATFLTPRDTPSFLSLHFTTKKGEKWCEKGQDTGHRGNVAEMVKLLGRRTEMKHFSFQQWDFGASSFSCLLAYLASYSWNPATGRFNIRALPLVRGPSLAVWGQARSEVGFRSTDPTWREALFHSWPCPVLQRGTFTYRLGDNSLTWKGL